MQSSTSTGSHSGSSQANHDLELCSLVEQNLYTAVVSDSLDQLGARDQAMREYLRPLHAQCRFAGWARTISCADIYHIPENPYAAEIEAVDSLLPGEVAVVGTGKSTRNAPWGELLSTASRARGARGAVVDGLVRDVHKIEELGFPRHCRGHQTGGLHGTRHCNSLQRASRVRRGYRPPGYFVFADFDGVIVVPRAMVREVIKLATDKVRRENDSRAELMQGAFLRDVFAKFQVL